MHMELTTLIATRVERAAASEDVLARLSIPELWAFYSRLADTVDRNRGALSSSLAALLMRHWLENKDPRSTFVFEAPEHLRNHTQVRAVLAYHRRVYLGEERARFSGGAQRWAGVLPRLMGVRGFTKWAGSPPLALDYQSLVEMPLRYQLTGNDADRDLLYALHGFQLKSTIVVSAATTANGWRVSFQSFEAEVIDRYDFDYSEHLTVPNPDFGSKAPGAVSPSSKSIVVYHRNAKRLEDAGRAAPYDVRSKRWAVGDAALRATAELRARTLD
jgi:hypothetical protein